MRYAYWFANVKGIGNAKKTYLAQQVHDISELFEMSSGQLKELDGMKEEEWKALIASRKSWNPDKEWTKLT